MNFRSAVSSCANRPIEVTVRINQIESAKSIADLKKLYSITGAKVQTIFKDLDSPKARSQEDHQRSQEKKSLHSRGSCTERKTLSHGKACHMDDV